MSANTSSLSLIDLLSKSETMSAQIQKNPEHIGRYGLDLPGFTETMKKDIEQAKVMDQEQEQMKAELKMKTDELTKLKDKINQNYALAKRIVKTAEPQIKWLAYGIEDKK